MLKRIRKIVFSHIVDVWTMHICRRIHSIACWRFYVTVFLNAKPWLKDANATLAMAGAEVLDGGSGNFTYKRDKAANMLVLRTGALPGYYAVYSGNSAFNPYLTNVENRVSS